MPIYVVAEQEMTATGVVKALTDWLDDGRGGRQRSDRQTVDERTGKPVWQVEVLYLREAYGEASSVTAMVLVPGVDRPVVSALSPVGFEGLRVDVRINKAKALVEYWSATGMAGTDGGAGAVVSGRASRASAGESA